MTTALAIALGRHEIRALTLLGTMSYSHYLVHVPVEGRMPEMRLTHVHAGVARVGVLFTTLALTVGTVTILRLSVERPAQRRLSATRYRNGSAWLRTGREAIGAVATCITEP